MSTTRWPKKGALILKVIRALFAIKKGDIVFLQRTISNKYFFVIMVAYLKIFRRKVIFDFDDPVYVRNHSYLKTKIFTQMADAVFVCTHAQAEWAKQYNKNVHVIHISLMYSEYAKYTKDYSNSVGPCVIGWIGSGPEHLRSGNLGIIASVLRKLVAKTHAPFKFVLVGALGDPEIYNLFRSIDGLSVDFIDSLDWVDPDAVPSEIQTFDIGVLPHQTEGEWNQGKSSFKILEYMGCGVASVCTLFGEMSYIITDGVNGYLADSEDEWIEKLEKLVMDRDLRARFGKAGQERIREEYCFESNIPRMIEIIDDLKA